MSPLESLLAEINQFDQDLDPAHGPYAGQYLHTVMPDIVRRQNAILRQLVTLSETAPHTRYQGLREYRCFCQHLLARLLPEGVEVKCCKCKRIAVIPWENAYEKRESEK